MAIQTPVCDFGRAAPDFRLADPSGRIFTLADVRGPAATLVMWTGFSLFSRYAGKSVLTPYDVFALRLSVAALVLLPFAPRFLGQGAWRDQRLWLLASLGSLLYCLVVYTGFRYAPAAHGAILLSGMQPFLISAIVLAVDGIRPNRMRSLGLIGIATGIACAAVPYFNVWSPEVVFGDLLIFSGSVLWAIYSVLAKRWGYSPWTLTSAVAQPVMLPVRKCR